MAPTIPVAALAASSATAAYLLVYHFPEHAYGLSLTATAARIFAVEGLVQCIWMWILWPFCFSPVRHLPAAPGAKFFTGHFLEIMRDEIAIPMRRWINQVPNDGLIRYYVIGNTERIFLTSPKAIGEVLVTKNYDFKKPSLARAALGRLLGYGVLLAEGDEHRFQRKHLMPAFAFRHIKDLYPVFWGKSCEMVNVVSEQIPKLAAEDPENKSDDGSAVLDFSGWLNRTTLDIIGIAGMGCDFRAIYQPNDELNTVYRKVFNPGGQARLIGLLQTFLPSWFVRALPLKRNSEINAAAAHIRGVSRQLIVDKQRKLEEKGELADKDILSVALKSGGFSVENLVDQTMTFLAAGHETTATATQWALLELGRHPAVQQRLRAEVRAHLPSPHDPDAAAAITADAVDRMPYLHAVCNEVLRFWAPVPFTRREAIKDTTVLGQVVPKGTAVVLVPYAVNFSKELWGEDADEFNPERWMEEGKANSGGAVSNYANLTFLHGPRSCIGQGFAKAEFNCLLAAIVGRFDVRLEPPDREIKVQTGIVARPKGGLKLRMKVVDGW